MKRCDLLILLITRIFISSDEVLDETTAKGFEQSLKSPNEAYRYYCAFKLARAGLFAPLIRLISAEAGACSD